MSSAGQRPLDEETARATVKAAFAAVTADDVRVNIDARETGFVRYAVNEVTTAGQIIDVETTVTCAVGAKHASVSIHGLRAEDVAAAARRALEQARIAPDDPEWVPTPGPAIMKPVMTSWSDTLVSPADRAALVADSIAEAKKQGLTAYGFIQNQRTSAATATRAGFFGLHHATRVFETLKIKRQAAPSRCREKPFGEIP